MAGPAAVRSGPGQMPAFGPSLFSDKEVSEIAAYVQYLHRPDDRGAAGAAGAPALTCNESPPGRVMSSNRSL